MDRQAFFFILFLFTFYYLQSGAEQVAPDERHALRKFEEQLKDARTTLMENQYWMGYGNLTGFQLSYGDNLKGLNESLFSFDPVDHPFVESQKYSILPDTIRDEILQFWKPQSDEKRKEHHDGSYMLNISGTVTGEIKRTEKDHQEDQKLKRLPLKLPKYLEEFDEEYNRGQFEDAKRRYEEDPDHNSPPEYYEPPLMLMGNLSSGTWRMSINLRNSDYNYQDDRVSKFIQKNNLKHIDDAVLVKANINIKNLPESETHDLSTEGVYFQESGCLVTTTTSGKFLGYNALPHFAFDLNDFEYYNDSKILLAQLINLTDFDKEVSVDTMHTYLTNAKTSCEFINWFKFDKTKFEKSLLRGIDDELRNPQGIPLPSELPKLVIKDYLMYSPDCGIKISFHSTSDKDKGILEGDRIEVFQKRLRFDLTWFFGMSFVQLILLLRQVKRLHTPSALSSVSTASMYIIGLYDAILTMGFLLFSPLASKLYLLSTAIAVIRGIICVFDFLFIVKLLTAQSNERGSSWWEIMRGGFTSSTPNETATTEATGGGTTTTTTTPDTDNQPETPAGPPDPQVVFTGPDENYYYNGLMASLISLTIVFFFMMIQVSYWRLSYRQTFEFIFEAVFCSMWLPQFLRSTVKNRRNCCFQWEFIWGMSIIRLIPIWFLHLYKNNQYQTHGNPVHAGIITGYVLMQIFLIMLQERLGARFWVNDRWLPQAFDYQPILSVGDIENGFASDIFANATKNGEGGITESTTEELDNDGWLVCKTDCAVCMNPIEVPFRNDRDPLLDSNRKKQSTLKRMWKRKRDYMITPCHHIFHQECLEDWMKYKLLCPICRNSLPPI